MIRVFNREVGIWEKYTLENLDFIRRSFDEYAHKEMNVEDYKQLALKLTKAKYEGSRFGDLKWEIDESDE
jgi:hypothetical protein